MPSGISRFNPKRDEFLEPPHPTAKHDKPLRVNLEGRDQMNSEEFGSLRSELSSDILEQALKILDWVNSEVAKGRKIASIDDANESIYIFEPEHRRDIDEGRS